MIKFDRPINLNGQQLIDELIDAGVNISTNINYYKEKQPPHDDSMGGLWLSIDEEDQQVAANVISSHNGTDSVYIPTVQEKLAAAGITIDELKEALGL